MNLFHKKLEKISPLVTNTLEKKLLKIKVIKQIFSLLLKRSGSIIEAGKNLKKIKKKYEETFGHSLVTKVAKVSERYYWRFGAPGFPSKASTRMHENEINKIDQLNKYSGLRSIIFAITKKCPLKCEHCFEWDNLNKDEVLTTEDIISIIQKYQEFGTTQFMLSGGEPMQRINDIYDILDKIENRSDMWIITSGLGFTPEHAAKLKRSGLTGVMVSLDHFDEEKHNEFRGNENAFKLARDAVKCANAAGLVSTLSLCARKGVITEAFLEDYMSLAKKLGVVFVQILDARKKGKYSDKDIEPTKDELDILDLAYLKYNSATEYTDYPIINYFGYHQRRVGCFGGGNRFFYIDTDGDAQLCPYCEGKVGNAIDLSAEEMIDLLGEKHCHAFEKVDKL